VTSRKNMHGGGLSIGFAASLHHLARDMRI
jgi:hypothetical protein